MDRLEDKNIFRYGYGKYEILYSPIARCMAVVEDRSAAGWHEVLQVLTDYVPISQQKKVKSPEDYTLLTVLPNNICNFACSYCYSAAGRNRSVLSLEKLFAAINYLITSKPVGFEKPLSISFMGGGEPMLSWENVKAGICFAESLAEERGVKLNISVITNGSVVNQECMDFFLRHNINVSVSFEILPEVQNVQRKNFDLVKQNIQTLCTAGVSVQINATITPLNVSRMSEMLMKAISDFPQIKSFMFEPATGEAIYGSTENIREFYLTYVTEFRRCLSIADGNGVNIISFAYLRTVYPLERACPGEFCITADGFITGCYCVGSPREPLFAQTQYGNVVDGKLVFDSDKFQALINENVYSRPECEKCVVKWNCGGGCFHQYKSYSKAFQEEVCFFTRNFVEMIVGYRVEKYLRQNKGVSYPLIIKI